MRLKGGTSTARGENMAEEGEDGASPGFSGHWLAKCIRGAKKIGFSPWQKLYYDHIIRSEEEFITIWQYIDDNPRKWLEDEEYIDLSTQK